MADDEVEDRQREAALTHLRDEHARGAFGQDELERRTAQVREARTVGELLAATAEPPPPATTSRHRALRLNLAALVAGLLVAAAVVAVARLL